MIAFLVSTGFFMSACAIAPRPPVESEADEASEAKPDDADRHGATERAPGDEEAEKGRSLLLASILYLPNRLLDLGDIVRVGVNAGPGIGLDVRATRFAQAAMMTRTSVGVGFESFRHLPVEGGSESTFAVGPVGVSPGIGIGWYKSATDLRLELHPLIVGAHAAIDPYELIDFLVGIFGWDLSQDDW